MPAAIWSRSGSAALAVAALVLGVAALVVRGAAAAAAGAADCCEPGALLRQPADPDPAPDGGPSPDPAPPHCWRPADNATRALPLPCAQPQLLAVPHELQPDGALALFDGDLRLADLQPGSFCLGNLTSWEAEGAEGAEGAAPALAACFAEPEQPYLDEAVLGGCIIVSVVFFSLTALVYLALPELRDLQGKSIINFCVCFAIGLGILAGMRLAEYSDMALCATRGFLAYFFIICGFFWMNALSIQFLLSIKRPSALSYSWRGFLWYAAYAWGLAGALTAAMAAVNFARGRHRKPGIGLNHCWFISPQQQWVYMYSVMSLLCAANVAIFAYAAALLWRAAPRSLHSSHARALRYKFSMTLRLFILMGLPWIFEMAKSVSPSHVIWELLDLFNALQGVLVFTLLVVARRRALRPLLRRCAAAGALPACCAARLQTAARDAEEDDVLHTELPLRDLPPSPPLAPPRQ